MRQWMIRFRYKNNDRFLCLVKTQNTWHGYDIMNYNNAFAAASDQDYTVVPRHLVMLFVSPEQAKITVKYLIKEDIYPRIDNDTIEVIPAIENVEPLMDFMENSNDI